MGVAVGVQAGQSHAGLVACQEMTITPPVRCAGQPGFYMLW